MSAIGDLVALLGGVGGLSSDLIAKAIDLAQKHAEEIGGCRPIISGSSADSSVERRKAYDRERQRVIREKKRSRPTSSDVDASTTLLPSSSTDSQEKKEGVVGRARGCRLPPDWALSNADACFALPLVGERRMAQETEKFRDYWHARAGPGGVKLDWPATWRMWIRKAVENGKPNGKSSATMDAFDDLIAGMGGAVEGDPPMRDITPRGGHHG